MNKGGKGTKEALHKSNGEQRNCRSHTYLQQALHHCHSLLEATLLTAQVENLPFTLLKITCSRKRTASGTSVKLQVL